MRKEGNRQSFIYFLPGSLKVFLMINRDQNSPESASYKKVIITAAKVSISLEQD